ncbi:MAG: lytic transglycosylase domain-containing protein [Caldimicrobium sp.]|nr:lytic transglycosylase domain-containing protein [Caldimicrobium sp.]MCX7614115.1 lytic transglycosylase domain-containing protein [Caldimicrobium sp.]MDW8183008.1 lytic transglycosylase domain-containing protein [Caldimicrobium sp.]
MLKIITLFVIYCLLLYTPLQAQEERDLLKEHIENVEILPEQLIKHLPQDINAQISYFVKYFSTEKKETIQRWLKRCEPYLPYFRVIFRDEGLPEDLIYLAIVESGCNSFAVSPAKAVGIWQFIESTGKSYGLKVDYWIDERRDFLKATYAAARYLKRLHDLFGDWRLAVASYNAGEGRVSRALKARNLADYWKLMMSGAIPFETFAYVPQWLAITIIVKNPEKYGFDPIVEAPWDYAEVEVPGGIDLKALALAAETDWDTIRKLNGELRREVTPPGSTYILKIPFQSKSRFFTNLAKLNLKETKVKTPEGEVILYVLDLQQTKDSYLEREGSKNFNNPLNQRATKSATKVERQNRSNKATKSKSSSTSR